MWAQAERGASMPSRLIFSGHSIGSGQFWGDNDGTLSRQSVDELANAMPHAARQVEDLHLAGCYTDGRADVGQWRAVFPNLKTVWAYTGAAPAASAKTAKPCAATFDQALHRQEAVRPRRRLTPVLHAATECDALSRPRRDAASKMRKVAKPPSRLNLCPKTGVVAGAVELMARRRFPEMVRPAEQAARFMHPAHYELLWALAIELQRQDALSPTGQRVVLNGLLATAPMGEQSHEPTL